MKKLVPTLFLFVLGGCFQNETDSIPEQFQEFENLTVYSLNEKPAVEISLKKDFLYGGTDEILIGDLGEIAVDSSGRVFIADTDNLVIHVFEPDGRNFDLVGRDGRGPGEFSSIKSLHIRNDRLYAFDFLQNRVNIFNLDTFLIEDTISLAENRGDHQELRGYYPSIDEFYVISNNYYIVKFISNSSSNASHWQNVEMNALLYKIDRVGKLTGKLIEFTDAVRTIFPINKTAFDIPLTPFFGNSLTVFSNEGSIYWTGPNHFLIKVYSPEGAYERAFYYPFLKLALTRESAVADEILDLLIINPELFIQNINSVDLPETWPVITDLKIDELERLWIATTVEDMTIYEWWVLEETGELITKFKWPRDEPIEVIKNGYMYTRQTDKETSLQQVVRYRIEMEDV